MFDLFKVEVNQGDRVKLYLTSGKEPEGTVLEIHENSVLLQTDDNTKVRLFDKLIGGWDLIKSDQIVQPPAEIPENKTETNEENKAKGYQSDIDIKYKEIEIEINNLIKAAEFSQALKIIDTRIRNSEIPGKYKSSLLLKKAQIFSSLDMPQESEKSYIELIEFNEKIGAAPNNLSHLYTELARIQTLKTNNKKQAIIAINNALKYNPNNNYAKHLLTQIETNLDEASSQSFQYIEQNEDNILIEESEEHDAISKLIDIDIKEHKFTHLSIINNSGKPTAFIAKQIFEEAKATKDVDLSERYPIYLEAAKAFSELNVGSYDFQDYLESVANYSMLKGNSLFVNIRNKVIAGDLDKLKLTRQKDSACSYYLETLNILSRINPKLFLGILANYLKLNIVIYHIKNNIQVEYPPLFKGQFADVFSFCLQPESLEMEKIAYKTIVDCGASSIKAWNKLIFLPKGTKIFYDELSVKARKKEIFTIINSLEGTSFDVNSAKKEFLKESFKNRRERRAELIDIIIFLQKIYFDPSNFEIIGNNWSRVKEHYAQLTETDQEIANEIERAIVYIQPYLNRTKGERTNILIQVRKIIENQLLFINENTTYFGRTVFFGLLGKWKNEIDTLLEEKIAQSFPKLEATIDPPYFIQTNEEFSIPFLIKNNGETTAEGFNLYVRIESAIYENDFSEFKHESPLEIPSGDMVEANAPVSVNLLDGSTAVEVYIKVEAIYQGKSLPNQEFQFTIEKEPESYLTYEDIPWKDGPIPPEQLFKGRRGFISALRQHYTSINRDKPYILYGLTRTGKSSILKYLNDRIKNDEILDGNRKFKIITFEWNLQEISNSSNAREFYTDILIERGYKLIREKFIAEGIWRNDFEIDSTGKFRDLRRILEYLRSHGYYPLFIIDEFSYIKDLMDRSILGPAFLAALREYSLTGLASFIFAGTYDIKKLITAEKYGITGQLVHAIEYQVDSIESAAAIELISVIEQKLSFTPEAIRHIQHLSGKIPYFIQIICKSCGDYAVENGRRHIGYPELEKVVRILTGEFEHPNSIVSRLPPGKFQNNQHSPSDPKEIEVLFSSIAHFNKNQVTPRGVGIHELERLWSANKLTSYKSKLAISLQNLLEKKILKQEEDDGLPVYKFSVDLFRRWWFNHHQDINLELTTLVEE
jgi:AAA domain